MDSCFSGKWVKKAENNNLSNFAIQASCDDNQKSNDNAEIGGFFTKNFLKYQQSYISDEKDMVFIKEKFKKRLL